MNSPVVMLTTSETTTTRVLAVLAHTTVSGGNVSAMLAGLGESGRHFCRQSNASSVYHPASNQMSINPKHRDNNSRQNQLG